MYTNNSHMREFLPAGRLSTEDYLGPFQTSLMKLLCENNNQLISYIR